MFIGCGDDCLKRCYPRDAMEASLDIVYEDRFLVVVDKPSGLLSVPGRRPEHADCVAARVRSRFADATGPLTVHRLDMDTSGLIVLALDPATHRALSRLFQERAVSKRYEAVVDGVVHPDEGTISLPLRLDVDNRPYQIVDEERGRPAVTHWRVLARGGPWTHVEFVPHTGRTHQLRVHAAVGLGCPIRGDLLYGDPNAAPRLQLHATELSLVHPATGEQMLWHSPATF